MAEELIDEARHRQRVIDQFGAADLDVALWP